MVMWELTTGRKPFFNNEYDIELVFQMIDGNVINVPFTSLL
jgi:hypothetical protein